MRNKQDVLPKEFIYRLKEVLTTPDFNSSLHAFTLKRPTTFRANTLKISARDLRNIMFENGIKLENVPWYKDAFIVKNRTLRELIDLEISAQGRNFINLQVTGPVVKEFQNSLQVARDKVNLNHKVVDARSRYGEADFGKPSFTPPVINLYKEGYLYVQSLSSMIPPLVLDPKKDEKILDIAAAPGSKTTQMATMMGNTGEILGNDTSPIRRLKLQANLKIQGATNTYTSGFAAQMIWEKFPEFFDKVLCDVPCSMEGRFATYEPKSYLGWSVKKVKNLSKLQKWMLRSAVSAAKEGGRIVYSTCTISPEENEEVIDWILDKEKGNIILEKISVTGLRFSEGITEWEGAKYNPEVLKCARIIPSDTMEGFFIASIRKIRSNV
jgi:NOL1/NOP2/sun family putative RNA methylase